MQVNNNNKLIIKALANWVYNYGIRQRQMIPFN